jgi:hypothetical protein
VNTGAETRIRHGDVVAFNHSTMYPERDRRAAP